MLEDTIFGFLENDYERIGRAENRHVDIKAQGRSFDAMISELLESASDCDQKKTKELITYLNAVRLMERIAEQTHSIERKISEVLQNRELKWIRTVEPLYAQANALLQLMLVKLKSNNATKLSDEEACKKLKQLSDWYDHFMKSLTKQLNMVDLPLEETQALIHLLLIGRALERIGELAVTVIETVSVD